MSDKAAENAQVSAYQYALITRLDHEPTGTPTSPQTRATALRSALRGVDLGRYDEKTIDALAQLDDLTVRTLVSLIERAGLRTKPTTAADGSKTGADSPREPPARHWPC